ncbi:MAG: glucose-6-phosphate isomerase [Filifactoraceae bacterium]
MINLDVSYIKKFIKNEELNQMIDIADIFSMKIDIKDGVGNDFLGWVNLPSSTPTTLLEDIDKTAKKIQKESEYLVVIGIGGSYLGAKAVIEALKPVYSDDESKTKIIFAGHTISSRYMSELLKFLEDKKFSINVISKSGTTTEPAIAFRLLKDLLIQQVGETEARNRIYATTDATKGALKTMAVQEGYKSYVIPDDIGGRYSVFTPVALLPMAVAGYDISTFINGAKASEFELKNNRKEYNTAVVYASLRNILYNKGKYVEIIVSYEPYLIYLSEWFKQLFGESEGKDGKGIFPASVNFSTDLHSMGQYIQDGRRDIFETIISVEKPNGDVILNRDDKDLDKLNYISGRSMDYINKMAQKGTILAHVEGNVPNIVINMEAIDEYNLGYIMYFFEKSCAISGYLLAVNPFDQPGVEAYKKKMFELLGKK